MSAVRDVTRCARVVLRGGVWVRPRDHLRSFRDIFFVLLDKHMRERKRDTRSQPKGFLISGGCSSSPSLEFCGSV